MKKLISLGLTVLFLLFLAACGNTDDEAKDTAENDKITEETEEVLKIGAIPDQNAASFNRGLSQLQSILSEETGMKVEFVPSVDYAALVTAFQRGEIHLAWFGGLTSVQARNLVPEAESIVQRPRG